MYVPASVFSNTRIQSRKMLEQSFRLSTIQLCRFANIAYSLLPASEQTSHHKTDRSILAEVEELK